MRIKLTPPCDQSDHSICYNYDLDSKGAEHVCTQWKLHHLQMIRRGKLNSQFIVTAQMDFQNLLQSSHPNSSISNALIEGHDLSSIDI